MTKMSRTQKPREMLARVPVQGSSHQASTCGQLYPYLLTRGLSIASNQGTVTERATDHVPVLPHLFPLTGWRQLVGMSFLTLM